MITVGILGMGGMGWLHTSRYQRIPGVELVAVADNNPERMRSENIVRTNAAIGEVTIDFDKIQKYSDPNVLLNQAQVDVVDICLPTFLHAEYAIKALNRGFHVLCEKPMALNSQDARSMVETAVENSRTLMIAQVLRFRPEYIFLRKMIDEGIFGKLQSLNMWRISRRPTWSRDNWFLDPKRSGGVIFDLHIHDVDFVNSVFANPYDFVASGAVSGNSRDFDVIHTIYRYGNGLQVHMHAGWSTAAIPFQAGYEAWFDMSFVRFADGVLEVYNKDGLDVGSSDIDLKSDGYLSELEYYINCVRNSANPDLCLPASTLQSIELIERELAYLRNTDV